MITRQWVNKTKNIFRFATRYNSTLGGETPDVDYYRVLGLTNKASPDEIKQAYRKLAKKYHPDVNTSGKTYEPNAAKFREIAEAYAVLSIAENKSSYDNSLLKNENAHFSNIKSQTMADNRRNRDRSGRVPGPTPMKGSYAEWRLNQLEQERQKFNVNHLGYYNGGLPNKDSGNVRGNAFDSPGMPHNAETHNRHERMERDAFEVTRADADAFKNFQKEVEDDGRDRAKPYYPIDSDPEMRYFKNREYATYILFGLIGYAILRRVYYREKMRLHRNERLPEVLAEAPAHHFVNRGGVLIKKEVVGFAKYFKNDKELTDWYHMVYPDIMKSEETPST